MSEQPKRCWLCSQLITPDRVFCQSCGDHLATQRDPDPNTADIGDEKEVMNDGDLRESNTTVDTTPTQSG